MKAVKANIIVRPAGGTDAGGINAIYNRYIRESAATFEMEEYSVTDRRAWIEKHAGDARYPIFVAEDTGLEDSSEVCGFANAAPFDAREGYRSSVKTSVFVSSVRQGERLGARLYEALFSALAETDLHRAYGLIVAPNPASVALHEAFGFTHVATLNEVGRKFGRFHDVMWFEKRL